MLTGLIILGTAVAGLVAVAVYVKYAVDTVDGQDWMERHVR